MEQRRHRSRSPSRWSSRSHSKQTELRASPSSLRQTSIAFVGHVSITTTSIAMVQSSISRVLDRRRRRRHRVIDEVPLQLECVALQLAICCSSASMTPDTLAIELFCRLASLSNSLSRASISSSSSLSCGRAIPADLARHRPNHTARMQCDSLLSLAKVGRQWDPRNRYTDKQAGTLTSGVFE